MRNGLISALLSMTGGLVLPRKLPHSREPGEEVTGLEGTLECWGREGLVRSSQGRGRGSSEPPREYSEEKEEVLGGVQE